MRFHLEDHPVFSDVGVYNGGLFFAEGVVERVFNLLRRDAERGRLVTVNLHVDLRVGDLHVRGHVLERRFVRRHLVHQNRRPVKQLVHVGVLEAVLIH